MEVISVDRTASNHGKYTGVVRLTYDEIVLLSNALYVAMKDTELGGQDAYESLRQNWRGFEYVACHGNTSGKFA